MGTEGNGIPTMKRKLYGACAVTCRVSARPSCAHEGAAAARGVTRAYMSRVGSSEDGSRNDEDDARTDAKGKHACARD